VLINDFYFYFKPFFPPLITSFPNDCHGLVKNRAKIKVIQTPPWKNLIHTGLVAIGESILTADNQKLIWPSVK
jgi:hypothetical protein